MLKVLDQTAPALSQERTLNFEWGVVKPQWILLGLIIILTTIIYKNFEIIEFGIHRKGSRFFKG